MSTGRKNQEGRQFRGIVLIPAEKFVIIGASFKLYMRLEYAIRTPESTVVFI
jgi:hypothetical protein